MNRNYRAVTFLAPGSSVSRSRNGLSRVQARNLCRKGWMVYLDTAHIILSELEGPLSEREQVAGAARVAWERLSA